MKRIVCLSLLLVLFASGMAYGSSRGLAIKAKNGEKVGSYAGSYALLIGMSRYQAWPKLNSVPSEVGQVESLLKKRGFTVVKVMNLRQASRGNPFFLSLLEKVAVALA